MNSRMTLLDLQVVPTPITPETLGAQGPGNGKHFHSIPEPFTLLESM